MSKTEILKEISARGETPLYQLTVREYGEQTALEMFRDSYEMREVEL